MRLVAMACLVCASGCLRIIDLDDGDDRDAFVVTFDAATDAASELDCAVPLPCPPPSAGRATFCGRILDTESDEVVAAASPTRQACTSPTASGPCSLRVRYFDAIDLASNPTGALPLEPEEAVVDDCGRFRARDLPRATFGFIAIGIDDAPGVTPAEPHRVTGVMFANTIGSEPNDVRAYATRVSTDQLWTTSAGLTGSTFAERGVLLKVFVHRGQPIAGVGARRNGAEVPDDDFYFSDAGRSRRMVDPARSATGPNGSVLVTNSPAPIAHDGTGGEPTGCVWPENLGASVPGLVSVDVVEAQTPAGAACP